MSLIDSHAHLTFPELAGQVEPVLARCTEARVDRVITVGTDLSDARAAIALADRFPGQVFAVVGFHPHEAEKLRPDDLQEIATLWRHPRTVAAGEMGLDYHYDFADRHVQRTVFSQQLELADPTGLPIVIHSREALDDTIRILMDHGFEDRAVVFHCFTGSKQEALRIAEHGWRISFTGIVTFRKSTELQSIAKSYPAEQIMIETDSPYLSPVPLRGKHPNEPDRVAHIARFLADLRGVSADELAQQTRDNTRRFFNLP